MEVVGHETKGVDLPAGLLAGPTKGFQKAVPILIIL
jgi:hypothetical protein